MEIGEQTVDLIQMRAPEEFDLRPLSVVLALDGNNWTAPLEQVLQSIATTDLATILTTVAAMGVEFLINFFTVVVVAYLAITLSATALQNKKFKGLVSFVLFLAIMAALEWGTSLLPTGEARDSLVRAMLSAWPRYAAYLGVMVGSFWLSAWLLEHKVSL